MFLWTHLRLRRTQIWLTLLAAMAAGLCFVPLLNLLAYEFCLAVALVASLAGAHLGSASVAAARRRDDPMLLALRAPGGALLRLVGRTITANLLLLALPLALISLNALRVKNCDLLDGLAFFALLPMLSLGIATSVGVLWAVALPRPALATTAALLTVLASIALGVYRFYAAPPIFGYDPFAGFFPGTLYDEDLSVPLPLLWYRLYNLCWIAAALLAASSAFDPAALRLRLRSPGPGRRRALLLAALTCAASGVGLYLLRAELGFAHDAASIRARLGGARRTPHFEILYPAELEPEEVELMAQDHELRYAQLETLIGIAPPHIRSFIFRSPEEKRALMGAGRTFIAKPWRAEVYLQRGDFPHGVLKHELAHLFAGRFGDRLFGVSLRWRMAPLPHPLFNVGLIEGFAVAADWRPYGELNGHQMAAALVRLGLAPPVESLFGYGFLTEAASRSYILAGSFCRYLLARHGVKRLRAAYASGGDFIAAYGRDLRSLAAEWSSWLAGVDLPADQLQLAREVFRQPSILRRVCGHEVANLLAAAAARRGEGKPDQAVTLLQRVCRFDPGDPAHLLELMSAQAAARLPASAIAVGARVLAHGSLSKPLERRALELIGDLRWRADDLSAARVAYDRADRLAAYAADRRLLHLKRWGLSQGDEIRRTVRDYVVPLPGKARDSALDVHLAHTLRTMLRRSGIGPFLVGKQLASKRHCSAAAPMLVEALERGLPDRNFVVEARRVLGACWYRTGNHDAATRVFSTLHAMADIPSGMRLEATDWLDRLAWRRTGTVTRKPGQLLGDGMEPSQQH